MQRPLDIVHAGWSFRRASTEERAEAEAFFRDLVGRPAVRQRSRRERPSVPPEVEARIVDPGQATDDVVAPEADPVACPPYPAQLRVRPWPGRVGLSAAAQRRLARTLKTALIVRGEVRVPLARARWLLDVAKNNLVGSFDDLAKHIPEVNVTIELFRILRPQLVSDATGLGEAFAQYVALRHLGDLKGCPYHELRFGPIDHPQLGRAAMEENLGLDLGPLFQAARIQDVPAAERGLFGLVVYASFPDALGERLRFRPLKHATNALAVPGLPKGLKADRLAGFAFRLPVHNVRSFLAHASTASPGWTRRIVDRTAFMSVFRSADVRIELLRLEPGPWPPEKRDLFEPYVTRSGPNQSAAVWFLREPAASVALERQLRIDLGPLMASRSPSDPRQHALLVGVWFPADERFERLVVSGEEPILDRFAFDRADLTPDHRRRLLRIARHIDATWRRAPWERYQPVHRITVEGHTDHVGSEGYNERLGQARADAVAGELRRLLAGLNGGQNGDLARRVHIEAVSRGMQDPDDAPRGQPELNRRVQVFLNTATPARVLKEASAAALAALPGHPGFSPSNREVIRCLLERIVDLGLDDRYVGTNAIEKPLAPQLYPRIRDVFLRAAYMPYAPVAPTKDTEIWERSTAETIAHLSGTVDIIDSAIAHAARRLAITGSKALYPTAVWLNARIQGQTPSLLRCFA
ncbi:MAG: OmpA family protein [Polyangiaceae bacterium]|nr:OmpA family protein [Polyangiaceae bacterium]